MSADQSVIEDALTSLITSSCFIPSINTKIDLVLGAIVRLRPRAGTS